MRPPSLHPQQSEALLFIWFLSVICVIMGKNTLTRLLFRKKAAKPARRPAPAVEKNPAKRFFDSLQKGTHIAPPFTPSKGKRKIKKIFRKTPLAVEGMQKRALHII